jgi:hypothetical protein
MRVQKADDIMPTLLALEHPWSVKFDASSLAGLRPCKAPKPHAATLAADQYPRSLNNLHG